MRHAEWTATVLTLAGVLLVLSGCEREQRAFRDPPSDIPPVVQTSGLQPGPLTPNPYVTAFQENRWAIGQGQIYYVQFNCAGCHSPGGGGGMGPPFTDAEWIYGSEPENIFASIVEGRPNGMPAFRGRISTNQVWYLAAYLRSLSGLTPPDTRPGRLDEMEQTTPPYEPELVPEPPS